jgi:hypothetical protein
MNPSTKDEIKGWGPSLQLGQRIAKRRRSAVDLLGDGGECADGQVN